MSTKDLKSNIKTAQTLAPAARTSSANGAGVDTRNFDSACFEVCVGALTTGGIAFAAKESDDDVTYSAVAATDLEGAFPNLETGSPTFAGANYKVGYKGSKRYIRCDSVHAGSPSGDGVYGVNVLLGHAHRKPVA